ncbi:hypothetical protein HNQ77_000972 [Silvibacterium bohemicum]|uniref:Uncharacterized protein n=1 Tax=Silvibacterium bohemicum TaxID=1577686 RepID=A0A841JX62_9BACT|nr:hypothetical protein [Silvibacterium bohemicum]MBB6143028.1 hypothetical protein [Silvibacterium bohemicum]
MDKELKHCFEAPFYILGPLVTSVQLVEVCQKHRHLMFRHPIEAGLEIRFAATHWDEVDPFAYIPQIRTQIPRAEYGSS